MSKGRKQLAANRHGYRLLGLILGNDTDLAVADAPITASLVVATHEGRVLFGFNRWRELWEAPAGRIEPGETAFECAARELREESCQAAECLALMGLAEVMRPSGERKFTAIFSGSLPEIAEFRENDEWSCIALWDLSAPIGDVDEVDLAIVRGVVGS